MKKFSLLLFFTLFVVAFVEATVIPDMKFRRLDTREGLSNSMVGCIYRDSQGYVWFGTGYGLNRYDGYRFRTYFSYERDTTTLRNNRVDEIQEADGGRLWLKQGMNYSLYDPVTEKVDRNPGRWLNAQGVKGGIESLHIDSKKNYWVKTYEDGFYYFNPVTKKVSHIPFGYGPNEFSKEFGVSAYSESEEGMILVSTYGELMCIDGERGKVIWKEDYVKRTLDTYNDYWVMVDKDQNIWVSCYKKGLFEMNKGKDAFATWKFSDQHFVLGSGVSSVALGDDGGLWCTVQKSGIYHFDRYGKITPAPHSPAGANCIYRDRKGNYWVGSEKVLYSYHPSTGASVPKLNVDGWGINCMADDGEGVLYICNYGKGLCIYNTATGETKQLSMYQTDSKKGALCNDWVKALLLDSHGLLWIATVNGLCVMNPADGNFKVFGWEVQLSGVQCFALCEYEGVILIGTDKGLYQYDRKQNKVIEVDGSEEIENKPVYSIIASRNGDLWMSSANGIWQYERKGKRYILHASGSGLDTREFTLGAFARATDDRIFFGSNEGIAAFYPDEVAASSGDLHGEIFLTNFTIDGKSVGCLTDEFVIPYDQNSFAMEFSMLTFRNADNISFEYRVNGGAWRPMDNGANGVTFNRMKPGKYVIEVRAASNGGHSEKTCKQFTVSVHITVCLRFFPCFYNSLSDLQ